MKAKVIIILSTVAVLHLVLGGMFLTGGCAPEEPPMPPGIYVPQPTSKTPVPGETTPEAVGPAPGTAEFKEQVSQKEEPFAIEPVEQVQPTPPAKQQETKKPAPVITDKDTTYIVKKGDSLWKISRTYGISIAELAAYNNIAPSKPIKIGQKLIIPAGSNAVRTAKAAPAATDKKAGKKKAENKKATGKKGTGKAEKATVPADGIYIVKEGDSFSRIAAKYHVKVADIEAANPGVSSNRLQIGQKLNLPTGKASAVPAKAKAPIQQEKKALPVNEDILLDDIPNPDAAVPAPAVNTPASAAEQAVAPVTDKPLASEDAVKAVTDTNQPAVDPVEPQSLTDTAGPAEDTTIDAIAAKYGVKADDIKTLNPALPADGKIKAGTVVQLP